MGAAADDAPPGFRDLLHRALDRCVPAPAEALALADQALAMLPADAPGRLRAEALRVRGWCWCTGRRRRRRSTCCRRPWPPCRRTSGACAAGSSVR